MNWLNTKSRKRFSLGTVTTSVEPEINLIPFIDVLLVILIFLMISTTFTRFQELAITLPTANDGEAQLEVKQIHIAVSRDGRFAVNGKVVDLAKLAAALEQLNASSNNSSVQVSIDADAKAPHQSVMNALEAARDANLTNIVFSSQTKK